MGNAIWQTDAMTICLSLSHTHSPNRNLCISSKGRPITGPNDLRLKFLPFFREYSIKRQEPFKMPQGHRAEAYSTWNMSANYDERHVKGLTRAGPAVRLRGPNPSPSNQMNQTSRLWFQGSRRRTTYDLLIWFLWLLKLNLYIAPPCSPAYLLHCCCLFYAFWFERKRSNAIKI